MKLLIDNVTRLYSRTFLTQSDGESGQTLVEYGLILALISIAAIAIMGTVGGNIIDVFTAVANKLHS